MRHNHLLDQWSFKQGGLKKAAILFASIIALSFLWSCRATDRQLVMDEALTHQITSLIYPHLNHCIQSETNPDRLSLCHASLAGDSDAQYRLGVLYDKGFIVELDERYPAKSLENMRQNGHFPHALEEGFSYDLKSTHTLADEKRTDIIARNPTLSLGLLTKAAWHNDYAAQKYLRMLKAKYASGSRDALYQQSIALVNDVVTTDLSSADYAKGIYYLLGEPGHMKKKGLAKSKAAAQVLFQRAADKGHAGAQRELGRLFLGPNQRAEGLKTAAYWLRQAAKQNDSQATFLLATIAREKGHHHQAKALYEHIKDNRLFDESMIFFTGRYPVALSGQVTAMEKLAKAETLFHLATLTLTDTKKGAERIAAKKEGLLLLQKTLEFYPKHIGAHYALGQLYKEGGVTPRSYHESFIHLQQASDEASLTVIEKDLTHLYYRFSSEEVEPFYQAENKGAYKILASMLNDDLLPAKDAGLLMSQMASVATKNIPSYKARKKSKKHLASYAKRKELDDYLTLKADDLARQKDSQQESYKDSIVKLLYTKAGVIDQNAEILTKDTLEEMVAIEADDGVSSERLSLLSGQAGRNSKGRKIAERSSKGLVTPVLW